MMAPLDLRSSIWMDLYHWCALVTLKVDILNPSLTNILSTGVIPFAGDVTDAALNYFLVVRPARKAEIPGWLLQKMLANNAVSAGVGLIPLVGDVILAVRVSFLLFPILLIFTRRLDMTTDL